MGLSALPGANSGNVSRDLGDLLIPTDILDCKRYTIPVFCIVKTDEEYLD